MSPARSPLLHRGEQQSKAPMGLSELPRPVSHRVRVLPLNVEAQTGGRLPAMYHERRSFPDNERLRPYR